MMRRDRKTEGLLCSLRTAIRSSGAGGEPTEAIVDTGGVRNLWPAAAAAVRAGWGDGRDLLRNHRSDGRLGGCGEQFVGGGNDPFCRSGRGGVGNEPVRSINGEPDGFEAMKASQDVLMVVPRVCAGCSSVCVSISIAFFFFFLFRRSSLFSFFSRFAVWPSAGRGERKKCVGFDGKS